MYVLHDRKRSDVPVLCRHAAVFTATNENKLTCHVKADVTTMFQGT